MAFTWQGSLMVWHGLSKIHADIFGIYCVYIHVLDTKYRRKYPLHRPIPRSWAHTWAKSFTDDFILASLDRCRMGKGICAPLLVARRLHDDVGGPAGHGGIGQTACWLHPVGLLGRRWPTVSVHGVILRVSQYTNISTPFSEPSMARTFVIWVNQLLGVPGPSPWPAIALTVALFLVSSHILALLPGRRRTPLRPRSRPRARSRPHGTHTRPQGDPRHPTHTAASAPPVSLADRILRQASAYARVTVNLAGTILHEIDPSLLSASATPVPEAADLLTWLCAATDVYVVVRVVDDQGEENVRASLQKLGYVKRSRT